MEIKGKIIEGPKQEFKHLEDSCGAHCGAIATIGSGHITVGHCKKCHQGLCDAADPKFAK